MLKAGLQRLNLLLPDGLLSGQRQPSPVLKKTCCTHSKVAIKSTKAGGSIGPSVLRRARPFSSGTLKL